MRAFNLIAAAFVGTALAASPGLAADPVTVGFLPKLDTDPYFRSQSVVDADRRSSSGGASSRV